MLRGGALKPAEKGKWVHVVCALTVPEVEVGDTHKKEPITLQNIPRSRRRLVIIIPPLV